MNELDKIKAQFERKNKAGNEVNILAYHPEQEYPIIAEVSYGGGWSPALYLEDGSAPMSAGTSSSLIKKRPVLPKDILCEVWEDPSIKYKRYSVGNGCFYNDGATSLSSEVDKVRWSGYRVIENPPQPWFGGECPIPEGCEYRVYAGNRWHGSSINWRWAHDKRAGSNITAYQILGEKESN